MTLLNVQNHVDTNAAKPARINPALVSSMDSFQSTYHGARMWAVKMANGESFTLDDKDAEAVFLAAKHITTLGGWP